MRLVEEYIGSSFAEKDNEGVIRWLGWMCDLDITSKEMINESREGRGVEWKGVCTITQDSPRPASLVEIEHHGECRLNHDKWGLHDICPVTGRRRMLSQRRRKYQSYTIADQVT